MTEQAYIVATLARGTASLGFTYRGRPGLQPGTLVAVSLRGKLEPGLVLAEDPAPPEQAKLLPLLELRHNWKRLGPLLIRLSHLAAAGVHEVVGHLLLDSVTASLRLELAIADAAELSDAERQSIGRLCGKLGTGRAKTLMKEHGWKRLCELANAGGISLTIQFAGTPGVTRTDPRLRRWYRAEHPLASAAEDGYLPGCYLHGLGEAFDPQGWLHREQKQERWQYPETGAAPDWQAGLWPEGWRLLQDIPGLGEVKLQHCHIVLSGLADALYSASLSAISAGRRLLVVLPQLWLQQRIWPHLATLAPRMHWYGSDSGISVASHILTKLDEGGQVVFGGPSSWKLAAWGNLDEVILVDPTHPQFGAEREPHLDYREALLATLAGRNTSLSLLEMGLSIMDGTGLDKPVRIEGPRPVEQAAERHDGSIDTDPLPLHLRQPGVRRLVHFNRLGSSRGLRCVDCGSLADCPNCGSRRIHFSQQQKAYSCPDCGFSDPRLRCQKCGLATLSSQLPGLEAVQRREGDLIVQGSQPLPVIGEGTNCIIGTSQLLEPPVGFRPEQVVHVQSDNPVGYIEHWPHELDMLARLVSLYEPDGNDPAWIVSERLPELLGERLEPGDVAKRYAQEIGLRRLALLPPFGLVYRFRLFARDFTTAQQLRKELGDELKGMDGTSVLRLGRPVALSGSVRLSGYFVNDELEPDALQQLRWRLFERGGTLSIQPVRGPWH
ncbi:MAG: hypothetical protein H7A35_10020 [Planctomycetales bacterium]|nr:hypothetical protein [bacterium]UNM07209.1 MAG: hypothetical protein H7A35_10020 [Planctomycetales bacterium]